MVAFTAAALTACGTPLDAPGSPLDGLRACPGASSVVGVVTGRAPTSTTADSPAAAGFDTWALTVTGDVRRLTDDGVHMGAVSSPDARVAYVMRSSGRMLGDSPEAPGVLERLDVVTGATSRMAELSGMVDLAVSGDGRRVAAAHTVGPDPQSGLDVNSISLLEVDRPGTAITLPRAPEAEPGLFSAVTEVALDSDGDRVAYALAIEIRSGEVENTLRIRDITTGSDAVVYTAQGTDFVSDVAWSADDTTVIAVIRHQEPGDTAESPARLRTLRVEPASGTTTLEEGFAQDISPASADGDRLVGLALPATAGEEPAERTLVSWTPGRGVVGRQSIDRAASEVSIASCSYQ